MHRYLLKKRSLLCFLLCYYSCLFLLFFVSHNTFDLKDHEVYAQSRAKAAERIRMTKPEVQNTAGDDLATARREPLRHGAQLPEQRLGPAGNNMKKARIRNEIKHEPRGNTGTKLRAHARPRLLYRSNAEMLKNAKESADGKRENKTATGSGHDEPESWKEWRPPSDAGEGGQPVIVSESELRKEQKEEYFKGKRLHYFNQFVSDCISLHRSVPRLKDPECQQVRYRSELPHTTVVIVFHNEAWSTLLRTVHSVLDRSPPHVLQRIILVDDFSDMDHLKKPLEDYLSQPELSKVTLLRSPSREGLIKARLLGLSRVNTPTVAFLDSHCECFEGWLEPLLDRVAQDTTMVVVPVIDMIDQETFAISTMPASSIQVGTFSWNLLFAWMSIQPSEKRRRTTDIEPVRSPTMAGGLFAISRDFFYKLGTYDPGMKIWGGENLELSFKIWMCGGTLEIIPCSHVGHVFRSRSPHSAGNFKNFLSTNLGRLAAVWLDDYSVYSYTVRRTTEKDQLKVIGDVSERQALRRRLQCHSFGWFMKHVMPEVYFPADHIAHGQIENTITGLCIAAEGESVQLHPCPKRGTRNTMNWFMNAESATVYQGEYDRPGIQKCLDYSSKSRAVDCLNCHGLGGNQLWKYSEDRKQLYHVISHKCAKALPEDHPPTVVMAYCNSSDPLQQWKWDTSPTPGPSWRKDEAAGIPVL